MKRTPRTFVARRAVLESVPLLVGLFGPSGSGKTFSALRLATGMQRVIGGDIFYIDTESGRALHYADRFQFRHVPFAEPFGSLDYADALKWSVDQGGKVIVIDSASHEHEGVGGYLWLHDQEVDSMSGGDQEKAKRVAISAWAKPAAYRRALINSVLQLNASFVFCFRAKDKVKPQTGRQPLELGYMPIAGDEMLFEMTVNCLLLPRSEGVPTWESDKPGEVLMIKRPEQFRELFAAREALSERHGEALALWARGGSAPTPVAAGEATAFATALRAAKTRASLNATWTSAKGQALRARLALSPELAELEELHASLRDAL